MSCCQTEIRIDDMYTFFEQHSNRVADVALNLCTRCTHTLAALTEVHLLDWLLGRPPSVSPPSYNLRRGSSYAVDQIIRASLGKPRLFKIMDAVQLLYSVRPFISPQSVELLCGQLTHASVSRYVHHRRLCSQCSGCYCDELCYRPIYAGPEAASRPDLGSWLASFGINLSKVSYLLIDGPSCLTFKFGFFVQPAVAQGYNSFAQQIQNTRCSSPHFFHMCICSALYQAYHVAVSAAVARGLTKESAKEVGQKTALLSSDYVYAFCFLLAKKRQYEGCCHQVLRRLGMREPTFIRELRLPLTPATKKDPVFTVSYRAKSFTFRVSYRGNNAALISY